LAVRNEQGTQLKGMAVKLYFAIDKEYHPEICEDEKWYSLGIFGCFRGALAQPLGPWPVLVYSISWKM